MKKRANRWWEIIKDIRNQTFDVIGTTSDDTLLTNNVVEMCNAGVLVQCDTPQYTGNETEEDLHIPGYTREKGLYQKVLSEFESKTGRALSGDSEVVDHFFSRPCNNLK